MTIDKDALDQILKDIALTGSASEENRTFQVILASRSNAFHLLDNSSGLPKIRPHIVNKFKFLIAQPTALQAFNPFEIRCCLCHKVISYPAWYYTLKYSVNEFHYFVCFDGLNPNRVTARCYRR